jgi:hypothetical protein
MSFKHSTKFLPALFIESTLLVQTRNRAVSHEERVVGVIMGE